MNDDRDEDLRQEQEQDRQFRERLEQDIKDAIEEAQRLGLKRESVHLIKWAAGVR